MGNGEDAAHKIAPSQAPWPEEAEEEAEEKAEEWSKNDQNWEGEDAVDKPAAPSQAPWPDETADAHDIIAPSQAPSDADEIVAPSQAPWPDEYADTHDECPPEGEVAPFSPPPPEEGMDDAPGGLIDSILGKRERDEASEPEDAPPAKVAAIDEPASVALSNGASDLPMPSDNVEIGASDLPMPDVETPE